MDNMVEGIRRSRFLRTMSENAADDEGNALKTQQKTNSSRERITHFEDEGSRSRSRRRKRSGRGASVGKNRRSLMPRRSHSYSSDDSSSMSSDIEAAVAAAALVVSTHAYGSSSSNSSREKSPVSSHAQNSWSPLPRIGEESSRSRRHYDQHVNNPVDSNSRALVPYSSMERKSNEERALVPMPSRKKSKQERESASGPWDKQIVPSGSGASDSREESGRMSRNSSRAKESRRHNEIIFEESQRGKKEAKAAAWREAEITRIEHRFGMKGDAIYAWENERIKKEEIIFKEIEKKLSEKRMKAFEKMRSDIDRINKKAERQREKMKAKKDAEIDEVLRRADNIRRSGRASSTCCTCG